MNIDKAVKWYATGCILVGAMLSSANLYPWNIAVSLLGEFGWIYASIRMKDPPLIVISLAMTAIFLWGGYNYFTGGAVPCH